MRDYPPEYDELYALEVKAPEGVKYPEYVEAVYWDEDGRIFYVDTKTGIEHDLACDFPSDDMDDDVNMAKAQDFVGHHFVKHAQDIARSFARYLLLTKGKCHAKTNGYKRHDS